MFLGEEEIVVGEWIVANGDERRRARYLAEVTAKIIPQPVCH